jgi:hypothetical protein
VQVDAHLAGCTDCERAIGRAEEMVALLEDLTVPEVQPPASLGERIAASARTVVPLGRRRRAPFSGQSGWLAMAASVAFVLGIGGGMWFDLAAGLGPASDQDSLALATIATSHFLHASFTSREPGAPPAKVLYARDGSWLYVIVDAARCDCRIVARRGEARVDLGPPRAHGLTETLFLAKAGRPGALALISGENRTLGDVNLPYSAAP